MADNIRSLESFNDLFANFVQERLNMEQEKDLISYPEDGQPSFTIDEDVCFVHAEQSSDERSFHKNRTKSYDYQNNKVIYTQGTIRTINIQFVFYGRNSDILMSKLNEMLYFDSTKQWLRQNNLSLVSERISLANKIHENFNGQWWERSDLNICLYDYITVEEAVDLLESADIRIFNDLEERI